MRVLSVIIACLVSSNCAETNHFMDEPAQNKSFSTSFQLQVPGSQPITIFEDPSFDPSTQTQRDPKYKITKRVSTAEYTSPDDTQHTISIRPFPLTIEAPAKDTMQSSSHGPSLLEQFLQQYGKDPEQYSDGEKETMSQNLENYFDNMERKNRRPPNKQNNGWVSLEAVPTYSSAKIYKWNSYSQKYKPNRPSYGQTEWEDEDEYNNQRPYDSTYSESNFNDDRPYQLPPKPFSSHFPNQRPTAYKPHNEPPPSPQRPSYDYEDERYYAPKKPWSDVVTDNRPSNFPAEPNQGHGYAYSFKDKKDHPDTYPTSGNGRWVLVSTTKGKQAHRNQKRNRALQEPASVSTVLHVIPSRNSKNITTHNGEVIEVAKHSGRGHSFAPTFHTSTNTTKKINRRVQIMPAQDTTGPVFAAVGAGLIPATLSLVAPMVLGRRRRDLNRSIESQIQREPPISVTGSSYRLG